MEDKKIVQAYAMDKQKLAELVIRAKGNTRTMAQFAEDTGISAPTLSRIANGKINNPLAQELLQKIFDNRCEDADFTLGSLLAANGMVDRTMVEKGKDYVDRMLSARDRGITIERHMKNAIMNALLERGLIVQSIPAELDNRKSESPFGIRAPYDFNFYLPNETLPYWYFETVGGKIPAGFGRTTISATQLFLIDAWSPEFLNGQRTSFVFEHRVTYESFIARFKDAPITNAFSAILVNMETETVIEETWLSKSIEIPSDLSIPVQDAHGEVSTWVDEDFDEEDFE